MRKLTLTLYNLLFVPILLLLLPGYLIRSWQRGGYRSKAAQRFGCIDKETMARIGTGRIWLHAVSVGEVGIALKFATEFHRRNPDCRFLVSTTTSTGLAILEQHASEWLEPLANPVDFPIITARLIRKLRPSALLMIEADLWPNRIAACLKLGLPTALLNARLSRQSESRFRRARLFTAPFFNQLDLITLTGSEDLGRWLSLGVNRRLLHWTGNMKYDTPMARQEEQQEPLPVSLGWNKDDPLFLAASTHAGEEREIARAFLSLRQEFPKLRLVITPRHVERRNEILEIMQELGLSVTLRSTGVLAPADALLLDTTGELSLWYRHATVAFVGKSLPSSVNHGGQNMIEPLQHDRPVLIGPHTGNFEPLATQLCTAGAALRVIDQEGITAALRELLRNPDRRQHMVQAGKEVLEEHHGATLRTCELVERLMGNAEVKKVNE